MFRRILPSNDQVPIIIFDLKDARASDLSSGTSFVRVSLFRRKTLFFMLIHKRKVISLLRRNSVMFHGKTFIFTRQIYR